MSHIGCIDVCARAAAGSSGCLQNRFGCFRLEPGKQARKQGHRAKRPAGPNAHSQTFGFGVSPLACFTVAGKEGRACSVCGETFQQLPTIGDIRNEPFEDCSALTKYWRFEDELLPQFSTSRQGFMQAAGLKFVGHSRRGASSSQVSVEEYAQQHVEEDGPLS